jgi:exodeoxyribonuclease-3
MCRLISATCGGVRVSSVYVPNGRAVGTEHYEAKLEWLERLHRHLVESCDPDDAVAVCGDFNIAPDDRDVYDPRKYIGTTHTSPAERKALARLLDWGLTDSFRLLHDEDKLFTWWDYRAGDFHQHRGMRIDLILVTKRLAERVRYTLIDRFARKGKLPSDHAPLLIDLDDAAARAAL